MGRFTVKLIAIPVLGSGSWTLSNKRSQSYNGEIEISDSDTRHVQMFSGSFQIGLMQSIGAERVGEALRDALGLRN